MNNRRILLFDGVCNLCNGFVQFILKNEKSKDLYFTSLQSTKGRVLLETYNIDVSKMDSVVYIEEGQCFKKSSAVCKLARHLHKPWYFIYYLNFLTPFLGDIFYDLIAKNRYRIFGKRESCWLPDKESLNRFI